VPPVRTHANDILTYNAQYRVLICCECQYAVQKSALESHLLRHKIYRADRQRLLSSVSSYDVSQPEDVLVPDPTTLPVEGLPIIAGLKCRISDCGHYCASKKRMRKHWADNHSDIVFDDFENCCHRVKLQTFFLGTKLRYFEVRAGDSLAADVTGSPALANIDDKTIYAGVNEEKRSGTTGDGSISSLPSPGSRPSPERISIDAYLEELTYFSHFVATTSLSLPHYTTLSHNWQTDFLGLAMQQRWLMCGLLALSACQLAVSTEGIEVRHKHDAKFEGYVSAFHVGMEVEKDVNHAGVRVKPLLCLAKWVMRNQEAPVAPLNSPRDGSYSIHALMMTIREVQLSAGTPVSAARTDSPRLQHSALLNRLHKLPSLMAKAFGRPDPKDIPDVLAIVSAVSMLIECCEERSATSMPSVVETVSTPWITMILWAYQVPRHFCDMVARHSPAALVVVAHWAVLVKLTEEAGCWLLTGAAEMITKDIGARLRDERAEVPRLIDGLQG
jgi:hypothetical protein